MSNEIKTNTLFMKLANILGQISYVQKDGRNEYFKYNYVTEAALTNEIRGKLADAGIFVFTSISGQATIEVPAKNGVEYLTTVTTEHTFVDGETGASFSVQSQGQGRDAGDKGVYKAITGAMKYFLYKNFMVPTGDDPEKDDLTRETEPTHKPAAKSSNGRTSGSATKKQIDFVTKLYQSHVWSDAERSAGLAAISHWPKDRVSKNIDAIKAELERRKAAEKAVTDDIESGAFADDDDLPF